MKFATNSFSKSFFSHEKVMINVCSQDREEKLLTREDFEAAVEKIADNLTLADNFRVKEVVH